MAGPGSPIPTEKLATHAQSRERLDVFIPKLLRALKQAQQPQQALTRLLPFVEAVARRSAYLLLLIENPQALAQLVKLCDASSWIAERLTKHPALLDELINPSSLYQIPTQVELAQELRQHMLRIEPTDLEAQMEGLRYFRWAQALKIAACEVTGVLPLMRVSDCLTYLAEVIIDYAYNLAKDEMISKHGSLAGDGQNPASLPFVIVAYGKLGGLELAHGSDLDLVFLHNSDPNSQTTGAKPIEASVFYPRLAQKLIHILATKTASGELYEVDVRLRPSGNSGPLVASLTAFEKYQRESAWTWEHMALTRARVLYGPEPGRAELRSIIAGVLTAPRDPAKLREDVLHMRGEMARHKPAKGPLDIKLARGGLVDVEFITHYLQLREGQGLEQSLRGALALLVKAGLVPPAIEAANRTLGRFLIASRLLAPDAQEPPAAARAALAQACQCEDWQQLAANLLAARRTVAQCWHEVFGIELAVD